MIWKKHTTEKLKGIVLYFRKFHPMKTHPKAKWGTIFSIKNKERQ